MLTTIALLCVMAVPQGPQNPQTVLPVVDDTVKPKVSKECLCSDNCVCGCNAGGVCNCKVERVINSVALPVQTVYRIGSLPQNWVPPAPSPAR